MRLISDIIEVEKEKKLEDFLVRMDIEKAFDSLDHNFLICNLAKHGFGNTFYLEGKDFSKRSGTVCY